MVKTLNELLIEYFQKDIEGNLDEWIAIAKKSRIKWSGSKKDIKKLTTKLEKNHMWNNKHTSTLVRKVNSFKRISGLKISGVEATEEFPYTISCNPFVLPMRSEKQAVTSYYLGVNQLPKHWFVEPRIYLEGVYNNKSFWRDLRLEFSQTSRPLYKVWFRNLELSLLFGLSKEKIRVNPMKNLKKVGKYFSENRDLYKIANSFGKFADIFEGEGKDELGKTRIFIECSVGITKGKGNEHLLHEGSPINRNPLDYASDEIECFQDKPTPYLRFLVTEKRPFMNFGEDFYRQREIAERFIVYHPGCMDLRLKGPDS